MHEFVDAVALRAPGARAIPSSSAKTRFHVELVPNGEKVDGTLTIFVEGEGSSVRRVPGAACEDAVQSMAVIAALVLGKGSRGGDARATPPEAAGSAASATTGAALAASPAASNSLSTVAPGSEAQPAGPTTGAELSPRREAWAPAALEIRAVAGGALESAVRSSPSFGVWGGADFVLDEPWPSAARLSVLYVPPVSESSQNGDAEFRLLVGAASICPIRYDAERFALSPCATLELGELHGQGIRVADHRSQSMLWVSGALSARPELRLASFAWLSAEAGVRVLAHNDRFVFDPGVTVHDVPLFAYHFALGLAVRVY